MHRLILWNLARNPIRSILTALTIAAPCAILVVALAVSRLAEQTMDRMAVQARLLVQHRTSFAELLPDSCRRKIEEMDPKSLRIAGVCRLRWFGGSVGTEKLNIPGIAVDADGLLRTHPDLALPIEAREAWIRERRAALVGRMTAGYYGWKPGDLVSVTGTMPPFARVELLIAGIIPEMYYDYALILRKDYLEACHENLRYPMSAGSNVVFVRCRTLGDLDDTAREIDRLFADSAHPTRTQHEDTLLRDMLFSGTPVAGLLLGIAGLAVAVTSLAAADSLGIGIRQRMHEFGVMRAVGFSSARIFILLLSEGLLLALAAGAAGSMLPAALCNTGILSSIAGVHSGAEEAGGDIETAAARGISPSIFELTRLRIDARSVIAALCISAIIGLLSTIPPALMAARSNPVDVLRDAG
ncbi:MAG: ABC transporter permease [Acidobacteriota bacterium]